MMRNYFILYIIVVSLLTACESQTKDVQSYLEEVNLLSQKDTYDKDKAIKILSEGLIKYPNDTKLLETRATIYCQHGLIKDCRADTLHILELDQNRAEAIMGLCMMDEFEGAVLSSIKNCYMNAAKLFADRKSTSIEHEIANKYNYVFALFMAEHPDAQIEKANLFKMVESTLGFDVWVYEMTFNNFDRNKMLNGMFKDD